MKPRIEELINREIDGETTPEELQELRRHLAGDPESQAYFEDLKTVAGWLQRVPAVEAPPSLKAEIMSEVRELSPVREAAPASGPSRPPLLKRWADGGWFPRPAYVWFAAAGFAAGLLVFTLWQGGLSSIDRSEVSGAMAPAPEGSARTRFGEKGIMGSFALVPEEGGVRAVLDLEAAGPVSATVAYDNSRLSIAGIRWEGGAAEVNTEGPGSLEIRHAGARRYTIWWTGSTLDPTSFRIKTYTEDGEVERTLQLSGTKEGD